MTLPTRDEVRARVAAVMADYYNGGDIGSHLGLDGLRAILLYLDETTPTEPERFVNIGGSLIRPSAVTMIDANRTSVPTWQSRIVIQGGTTTMDTKLDVATAAYVLGIEVAP